MLSLVNFPGDAVNLRISPVFSDWCCVIENVPVLNTLEIHAHIRKWMKTSIISQFNLDSYIGH